MSEQTENLCTTDACESLRARLAKYEDADGNPIRTIAEQARDIESLRLNVAAQVDAHAETRKELAALKAQPSGVVDSQRLLDWNRSQPEPRPIVVGREYQVAEACARLNSSPVSAVCDTCHGQGEVWTGENQSFGYMSMQPPEPIMEACPECSGELVRPASAGDDRKLSDIGNELHNLSCHVVHHNEGWANQLGALASELWNWQARAAITASAPNHGEQVRVPRKSLADFIEYSVPGPYECDEKWFSDKQALVAAIAASPSAGSQKEQGE